jgi:N-methylhydantoinase B
MALITHNVRTGREAKGDFQAQLAANNVGERRLHEIIQKYGAGQTVRYMEELIDYSERRMRARLRELPRGVRLRRLSGRRRTERRPAHA